MYQYLYLRNYEAGLYVKNVISNLFFSGYVIEKMDMDTGRWVPAGEVGPNTENFKVDGLTPKKKYKFRVKAVNKEGENIEYLKYVHGCRIPIVYFNFQHNQLL